MKQENGKLTRRQFLKGSIAGIAGAAAFGALGLTACAENTAGESATAGETTAARTEEAPETTMAAAAEGAPETTAAAGTEGTPEAAAQTGAAEASAQEWYGEEPVIDESEITEVMDAEVVVVGAGIAGVSAARSAAEQGAKVILIEKAEGTQGRGEDYAVINGSLQARYGRDNMDPDEIVDRLMQDFEYRSKRPILKRWADESAAAFDWFISAKEDLYICDTTRQDVPDEHKDLYLIPHRHPLPETYDYKREYYPIFPVTMQFLPAQAPMLPYHLQKGIDTGNLDTYFGVFAKKLLREPNGRVTGVVAQAQDGRYMQLNASKGVVLATGDYENDPVMLKHFCPDVVANGIGILWFNMDVNGNPTNTGDGLKMGHFIGARVQQNHAPMIHHMGGVMGIAPFLLLDKDGRRFCNEDCPGQQLENQIEMLRDFTCYQIFDSRWPQELEFMPASHGVACYYSNEEPVNNSGNRNYVSDAKLAAAVENGTVLTADTLEELMDQLDIDKAAALASIERYNKLAKDGYDADFNKADWRMFALENGPFYACVFGSARMLVCVGGLESDENCHVYDEDRHIIPGLYVCGNMQGNRFAVEYPTTVPGISHSMALTYGKIAGENAVRGI